MNKAYSELIKRKDAGTCMLKIYQECNFTSGVGTLLMPVVEQLLVDVNNLITVMLNQKSNG